MKIPKILGSYIVWAISTIAVILFLLFKEVAPWKINAFLLVMVLIYLVITTRSFHPKD